ncbi:unnamed protein product, partial [Didymodactylos carnosus]
MDQQEHVQSHVYCKNNCGFYASMQYDGYCSSCFQQQIIKNNDEKRSTVSTINQIYSPSVVVIQQQDGITPNEQITQKRKRENKQQYNRCEKCLTRVGLTGFECRCGQLFCSKHRYPNEHQSPLTIKQAPTDTISVLQSQNTTISLEVDGLPKPDIKWYFNDTEITPSAKHKFDVKQNTFTLNLNKADFNDSGTYKAVINNGIETLEVPVRVNVGVKPKLEGAKPQVDVACVYGEDAKMQFKFSGVEKPTVQWYRNNVPVVLDDRTIITEDDDGTTTLTVKQTTLDDKGLYIAKATNSLGEVEAKANLNITGIKPVLATDVEQTVQAVKGESFTIKLQATGTPLPQVTWMKGNDDLQPNDRISMQQDQDGWFTLKIDNCSPEDIGEYTAKVTNVQGTLKSQKCKVNVTKTPEFKTKPSGVEVKQGETAQFSTTVDGFPVPKVTWLLNAKPLTAKDNVQIEYDQKTGEAKLTIPNVDIERHSGQVTCRLESPLGTQEETVPLDVLSSPILSGKLTDQETIAGKEVTMKLGVKGSPKPDAKWYRNDVEIPVTDENYRQTVTETNEYQLTIVNPTVTDSEGRYYVEMKNPLGEIKSNECTITVLEPSHIQMLSEEGDKQLKVGDTFELECQVTGKEVPKVTFYKDGKELKPAADHVTIDASPDGKYKLTVTNVRPEDLGAYKVVAKNKTSTDEKSINVNITSPLNIVQPLSDQNVLTGQSGIFTITCDAFPLPKVTWFFNDVELKNTPKTKIEAKQNVYTLTVNKCDTADVGTYRALLDNSIDKTENTAKLNVGTKPTVVGKPQDQQVQIGQRAQLQAQFTGTPMPKIEWSRADGQPLPDYIEIQTDEANGTTSLTVPEAKITDKASYVARATSDFGVIEAKLNLDVKEIKPTIVRDLDAALNATKGEQMTLSLEATGNPQPTVKWFRGNDELVPVEGQIQTTQSDDGKTYTLTILNVQPDQHIGDYSATIQNTGGMVKSKRIKVNVTKTPEFKTKPSGVEVKQGETAQFSTTVDGFPVPKVTWLLNAKPLTAKDNVQIEYDQKTEIKPTISRDLDASLNGTKGQALVLSLEASGNPVPSIKWFRGQEELVEAEGDVKLTQSEDGKTYSLTLLNVQPKDIGEYSATVQNSGGMVKSKKCKVNVTKSPEFLRRPDDQTVAQDSAVVLEAEIDAFPVCKVTWLRDGKALTPKEAGVEVQSQPEKGLFSLHIPKCDTVKHMGTIVCRAENAVGNAEHSFLLNINTAPTIKTGLKDTNVLKDQDVTFTLDIQGYPPPTLTWMKGDIPIAQPNDKYMPSEDGKTLTVRNVQIEDEDDYSVQIKNELGEVISKAKLNCFILPDINPMLEDKNVSVRQNIDYTTTITGRPFPEVQILKN